MKRGARGDSRAIIIPTFAFTSGVGKLKNSLKLSTMQLSGPGDAGG